jgi:hypothetical protein
LIHQLADGAVRFEDRKSMIHCAREIGIGECDSSKKRAA